MEQQATVWVVDDDKAVLESLQWLMESVGYTVKTFTKAMDFLSTYEPIRIGCLVVDVRMQGMTGLELQESMGKRGIKIPVIFITGHGDVSMAVRAMKAGAMEFLSKPVNNQILLEAVNKAILKDIEIKKQSKQNEHAIALVKTLTPREFEVMGLMVAGKLNKIIAYELGISLSTVELHRAKVMKKIKVRSLAQLVRLVMANNLLSLKQ